MQLLAKYIFVENFQSQNSIYQALYLLHLFPDLNYLRIKANADEKIIEKLFKIVELVQCLDLAKLIILVNVKQYLDSDEIVEFYKYCVYNNVKLLVLERGSEVSPLERERILFVDENFDEFFIQ